MAMERFLAALVFCEAPLDAYGTSAAATVSNSKQLISGAVSKPATRESGAEKIHSGCCSGGEPRRAGFDGLNFFDSVMMN